MRYSVVPAQAGIHTDGDGKQASARFFIARRPREGGDPYRLLEIDQSETSPAVSTDRIRKCSVGSRLRGNDGFRVIDEMQRRNKKRPRDRSGGRPCKKVNDYSVA
jgi:hypothetical protein